MSAGAFGYLIGMLVLVTLLPAVIGGLLRRKTAPSRGWIGAAWVVAVFLAFAAYKGGGYGWPQLVALALLAALTVARYSAWSKL